MKNLRGWEDCVGFIVAWVNDESHRQNFQIDQLLNEKTVFEQKEFHF